MLRVWNLLGISMLKFSFCCHISRATRGEDYIVRRCNADDISLDNGAGLAGCLRCIQTSVAINCEFLLTEKFILYLI